MKKNNKLLVVGGLVLATLSLSNYTNIKAEENNVVNYKDLADINRNGPNGELLATHVQSDPGLEVKTMQSKQYKYTYFKKNYTYKIGEKYPTKITIHAIVDGTRYDLELPSKFVKLNKDSGVIEVSYYDTIILEDYTIKVLPKTSAVK